MFCVNAQRMQEAGMMRMSYAWFDPRYKVCPPAEQAAAFLATVRKVGVGELGPMIDIEDAPAAGIHAFAGVGQYIKAWLDAVEAELKVKPRIYTNLSFVQNYLFNSSMREPWLNQYGLVIANWAALAPYVPQPWAPTGWDCWQYTASAPGGYYGFHASIAGKAEPSICLAVWNGHCQWIRKWSRCRARHRIGHGSPIHRS